MCDDQVRLIDRDRVWLVMAYLVVAVFLLALMVACGAADKVAEEVPPTPTNTMPKGMTATPSNGVYIVGQSIPSGTYESKQPEDGAFYRCTWHVENTSGNILYLASSTDSSQVVTVSDGQILYSTGCMWMKQ